MTSLPPLLWRHYPLYYDVTTSWRRWLRRGRGRFWEPNNKNIKRHPGTIQILPVGARQWIACRGLVWFVCGYAGTAGGNFVMILTLAIMTSLTSLRVTITTFAIFTGTPRAVLLVLLLLPPLLLPRLFLLQLYLYYISTIYQLCTILLYINYISTMYYSRMTPPTKNSALLTIIAHGRHQRHRILFPVLH